MTRRAARRALGLTFVELLVVATVAGVLATLAIPTGLVVQRAWQERQLKRSLAQIRAALDAYHLDWEKGCIESDSEHGWPRTLVELTEDKELADDPQCTGVEDTPPGADQEEEPPIPVRRYLARVPPDPFNEDGEEHDTDGWNARAYDDERDSTTWGGDHVYDVYSSSSLTALDGTKHEEW